ncbi:hypothetical protein EMMF5_006150 [Cystobasidiomycetes sp. EMM_F5]
MKKPQTLGSCVTMPLKFDVVPFMDEITQQARTVGSVNTTYFRENVDGTVVHVGTNLDVAGVGNSLHAALVGHPTPMPAGTPSRFASGKAASLMIGGGGATRAAIFAMNKLGLSPILLLNRDAGETERTVAQFPELDLRPLATVADAEQVLQELNSRGIKLCAGVGAIPSIEPQSAAEKTVYEIAKTLFSFPYSPHPSDGTSEGASEDDSMGLPPQPCFLEMAYKPRMTIMRKIAEGLNWRTICGVEVVLEGCFEQAYLWTGKEVDFQTREKGRALLRAE